MMGAHSTSEAAGARGAAAKITPISVGKSRLRRGRPSEIRTLNRFRIFALTASPVLRGVYPRWIRANMHHLQSWQQPRAAMAFEAVALLVGEIMAAGVRNDAADAVAPVLPFGIDDVERILDADTLTGDAAMAYCFDLLRVNVLPLWCERAAEALHPEHTAHKLVYERYGAMYASTAWPGYLRNI